MSSEAVDVDEATAPMSDKKAAKLAKKEKFLAKQQAKQQQQKTESTGTAKGSKANAKGDSKTADGPASLVYTADTPPGSFKNLDTFPDSYSPKFVEAAWYSWWEKSGFFKPEYEKGDKIYEEENEPGENTFMMVIPPPNVTGSLHIGHGLTVAIEDTLTRWHRMSGRTTLWVPGCDHAGIATQVVVEKKLKRELGVSRHDIGREAFVEHVWKWKREKGHIIYDQIRALGASVDWERVAFTMDEKLCRAVVEAFVRLHEEKLIYRDNRLVNWSCTLKSAISDMEVDKKELTGRQMLPVPGYKSKVEFGVLVSFAYPIADSETKEEIVVSTTRIETMLADSAVAVHPEDERYKCLHGKFVTHPIRGDRMPIVVDDFVDMQFGTGAVKITPAHDHNDFEVGRRHKLPFFQMMNEEGIVQLIDDAEKPIECKYNGMKRFDARRAITEELKSLGLFKEVADNPMVVPVCSRSKDIVEPLLKPQWYVDCNQMAQDAMLAVEHGEIRLYPSASANQWNAWLERIRPWCISRQLWWGHRVPAYYVIFLNPDCAAAKSVDPNLKDDPERWISGRSEEEALKKACDKFKVDPGDIKLIQDEDVLDTWFSSGLFPFSVLGWPDETRDLRRFYPGALLETGHDIMFFWVARMVFMGQKLMGDIPFKEVFFHAMVRDAHGRKISKSLGNVVDPVDVIHGISLEALQEQLKNNSNLDPSELSKATEGQKKDFPKGIPECGTDALRFALCAYTAQGRDVNLDVLRVQGYRFFCNKIWNATKLCLEFLSPPTQQTAANQSSQTKFCPPDSFDELIEVVRASPDWMTRWIVSRLALAVEQCNSGLNTYTFPTATTGIYQFFLYEFCDNYLEHIKPLLRMECSSDDDVRVVSGCRAALFVCLDSSLKLLAPFMPFITEELWQRLPKPPSIASRTAPTSIHVSSYPNTEKFAPLRDMDCEEGEEMAFAIVRQIRATRANYDIQKNFKLQVYLSDVTEWKVDLIEPFVSFVATLAGCHFTILCPVEKVPRGCVVCVLPFAVINVVLADVIDEEKERNKLTQKKASVSAALEKLTQQMNKDNYDIKVPEAVRLKDEERKEELEKELKDIENATEALKQLTMKGDEK